VFERIRRALYWILGPLLLLAAIPARYALEHGDWKQARTTRARGDTISLYGCNGRGDSRIRRGAD